MARRTLPAATKEGILRDLSAGVNKAVIAKTYGVSIPTVYNFLKRQLAETNTALSGFAASAEVGTVTAPVATRKAAR